VTTREQNINNNRRYDLVCQNCGWSTAQDGHVLRCPRCSDLAFLSTRYHTDLLELSGPESLFLSYRQWLPCEFVFEPDDLEIGCVHAEELGRCLGLDNLWFLFSCYAPQYGGTMSSATFKSLEAAGVMLRVLSQTDKTLIISSAGNAGCAVLELGTQYQCPAVVVIPESAKRDMLISSEPNDTSPLLLCLKRATYFDAIRFVGYVHERFSDRLVREGGAYNVARRDAMGVPVVRAVKKIGRIPDHYFQAVGSGTGGIAAYEAVQRMKKNRQYHPHSTMKLNLVQNIPFTPMVDAWKNNERKVGVLSREEIYKRLSQTYSKVLANANPPYGVVGGVYDCVRNSDGDLLGVTNEQALSAEQRIMKFFDFCPSPETSVAFAGLEKQVNKGKILKNEIVLLHATGGGAERCAADLQKRPYPVGGNLEIDEIDEAVQMVSAYLHRIGRR
jgi:cysteate synthase